MSRKTRVPGVTVWQRGNNWVYQVEGPRDPLTGDRRRPYKGGFQTRTAALEAAIEAKKRLDTGRAAHSRRIRVRDFIGEWIDAVSEDLKASTAGGYRDSIDAYILPILGDRWLGDITVPTLNAFYKHLKEQGRRKGDGNNRMYAYWLAHADERDGLGPKPADMAAACGTTIHAARAAATRYRRGRVPGDHSTELSRHTVHNVHTVMRRALGDAVRWGYLHDNPAEHAIVPRAKSRTARERRAEAWTPEELARWLKVALEDRYDGVWCLAATTGMRRSELAGTERRNLDLDNARLRLDNTRVVVRGRAEASDGKSEAGQRDLSLDSFTVKHLRCYLTRIDEEREAHGDDYPDTPYLMVGPEGRPLHPDTITKRFNRLVDRAGVRRIRLHDVRHTYATLALDNDQNVKLLSERIGHADTSITLKIYTHKSPGRDRALADHMGALIQAAIDALSSQ